ncbi:MAG: hypothetical protein R3C11_22635 [Planctomycetaceae bacterium]
MPFSEGKGAEGRNLQPVWFQLDGWEGERRHRSRRNRRIFGFEAVVDKAHISDIHATILHLMGLDQ